MRSLGLVLLLFLSSSCRSEELSIPSEYSDLIMENACSFAGWEKSHPNYEMPPYATLKEEGREVLGLVCGDKIVLKATSGSIQCPLTILRQGQDSLHRGISIGISTSSKERTLKTLNSNSRKSVEPGKYLEIQNIYDGSGYLYVCVNGVWHYKFIH